MNVQSAKSLTVVSLVGLFGMSAIAAADNSDSIIATPDGYHVVPTQNSPGTAVFRAKVDRQAQTIEYNLSWENLRGDIIQSHIHFGRPASNGDIVLFLCGDTTHKPKEPLTTPDCINSDGGPRKGMVTGTLNSEDIIALGFGTGDPVPVVTPQNQLLPFANFEELANAIDSGATYVVVHTKAQPPGELRGDVKHTQEHTAGLSADDGGNPAQSAGMPENNRSVNKRGRR